MPGPPPSTEEESAIDDRFHVGTSRQSDCLDQRDLHSLAPYIGCHPSTFEERSRLQKWKDLIETSYQHYGFLQLLPDYILPYSHPQKKDRLSREMRLIHRFNPMQDSGFGLPFDRKLPLALYTARNHPRVPFPYYRYDIKGAVQQSAPQQADLDILDEKSITPEKQADCLAAIIRPLKEIAPSFKVRMNHLGLVRHFFTEAGIPEQQIPSILRVVRENSEEQASRIIAGQITGLEEKEAWQLISALKKPHSLSKYCELFEEGSDEYGAAQHLRALMHGLEKRGVDLRDVELHLDQGREIKYYREVVFDAVLKGEGRELCIASGGGYHDLVESYNRNAHIRGFGGSLSFSRLFALLKEQEAGESLQKRSIEKGGSGPGMPLRLNRLMDATASINLHST